MKKLSVLIFALFGLISAPAFACGGDKDGDKDNGLRPTSEMTNIVYCGGEKDGDKDDT